MSTTYFSEREQGPRPRTDELISQTVWRALLRRIEVGIGNGAFGWRFPAQCDDGYGPCGTDEQAFWDTAMAEVPDLPIPDDSLPGRALRSAEDVDTVIVLDLLEFCARSVTRPIKAGYHSFFGHHHLDFDRDAGLADFVNDVNLLFRRNGIAFELSDEGDARRLGAPGLREALREPEFNTGASPMGRPTSCSVSRGNASYYPARATVETRWRSCGTLSSASRPSSPARTRRRRPISCWTGRPVRQDSASFWARKPRHLQRSAIAFEFVIRKRRRNACRHLSRLTICFTGCSASCASCCARRGAAASRYGR